MPRIEFVRPEEGRFVPSNELASAETLAKLTPAERLAYLFVRHPGGPDQLQLFETKFAAGTRIEPHAHDVDEIIYVTQGALHVGKQVFGPGCSIMIPRMTLYSFTAGPDGVCFLNFRPRQDLEVITKNEFLARRYGRESAEEQS